MVLSCCIILLLFIIIFICIKLKKPVFDNHFIPEHENKFIKNFYPAAYSIFRFSKDKLHITAKSSWIENMKKLYIELDIKSLEKLYFCRLYSIIILIILCVIAFLILFTILQEDNNIIQNNYYIERDKPEGSNKEAEIDVSIDGDKRNVLVHIPAKKYSEKELETKFKEAMQYTRNNYLGTNKSPEEVSESLNLISYIPGSAVEISWECDTRDIVSSDGTLDRSQVEEPEVVQITAIFSYFEFKKDMPLEFTVLPVDKSFAEKLWDKWNNMFYGLSDLTASKDYLQLPSEVDGRKVKYNVPEKNYIVNIIAFGITIIVIMPLIIDSRIKEKIKQREQELRIDYPGFVEKFVLLIGAGLNCKGAWHRMTEEYKRECQNGSKKHYLYEEMLLTERQLDNGMNEAKAYELFGRRMGLLKYMKFSTLLVQNLKKGSADLLKILEYEAMDVLKERRENAKILGEQAGTKLLMPMVIMMAEVFAIIIFAAFQSM